MNTWSKLSLGIGAFTLLAASIVGTVLAVLTWGGPMLSQLMVVIGGTMALFALASAAIDAFRKWRFQHQTDTGPPEGEPHFHIATPDTELRARHFRPLASYLRSPFAKQVNRIRHGD